MGDKIEPPTFKGMMIIAIITVILAFVMAAFIGHLKYG